MLGFYNYTVILTYLGMLVSFLGITMAMRGDVHSAIICLMVSGVCDMFDGKIASTMKRTVQEKRFGIQIDSLSDLICFGVLPAVMIYRVTEGTDIGLYIGAIYTLCALIRLAYFNVDEEERQNTTEQTREIYKGLPVTTSALLIPLTMAVSQQFSLPVKKTIPVLFIVTAVLFLTPFTMKKPKLPGKVCMVLVGCMEFFFLIMGADM